MYPLSIYRVDPKSYPPRNQPRGHPSRTLKRAGGSERLVSLAMELHEKGLSWEAIAQQWNAESILMLTGREQ